MAVAAPLTLREGDRPRLEALTRSTSVRAGLAQRARIVLLAADGLPNTEIARRTGATRPTVLAWRNRYAEGGISALWDKPRSGRPTKVNEIEVIATTLADEGRPPEHLGAPHWSARLLAKELGISFATVARIWRKWGIQPDRVETFQFCDDPDLEAEAVGVYRNPLERSVVLPAERTQGSTAAPSPAGRPAPHPDPWLNLVEISLGILTQQAIRQGTFASVRNLIEAIGALTDGWNERPEPATAPPQTNPSLTTSRKTTSNTGQPYPPPTPAKIDLQKRTDQLGRRPRERASFRAEFHTVGGRLPGRLESLGHQDAGQPGSRDQAPSTPPGRH